MVKGCSKYPVTRSGLMAVTRRMTSPATTVSPARRSMSPTTPSIGATSGSGDSSSSASRSLASSTLIAAARADSPDIPAAFGSAATMPFNTGSSRRINWFFSSNWATKLPRVIFNCA